MKAKLILETAATNLRLAAYICGCIALVSAAVSAPVGQTSGSVRFHGLLTFT